MKKQLGWCRIYACLLTLRRLLRFKWKDFYRPFVIDLLVYYTTCSNNRFVDGLMEDDDRVALLSPSKINWQRIVDDELLEPDQ